MDNNINCYVFYQDEIIDKVMLENVTTNKHGCGPYMSEAYISIKFNENSKFNLNIPYSIYLDYPSLNQSIFIIDCFCKEINYDKNTAGFTSAQAFKDDKIPRNILNKVLDYKRDNTFNLLRYYYAKPKKLQE